MSLTYGRDKGRAANLQKWNVRQRAGPTVRHDVQQWVTVVQLNAWTNVMAASTVVDLATEVSAVEVGKIRIDRTHAAAYIGSDRR